MNTCGNEEEKEAARGCVTSLIEPNAAEVESVSAAFVCAPHRFTCAPPASAEPHLRASPASHHLRQAHWPLPGFPTLAFDGSFLRATYAERSSVELTRLPVFDPACNAPESG